MDTQDKRVEPLDLRAVEGDLEARKFIVRASAEPTIAALLTYCRALRAALQEMLPATGILIGAAEMMVYEIDRETLAYPKANGKRVIEITHDLKQRWERAAAVLAQAQDGPA